MSETAVIYVRVSTREQVENGVSLAEQEERMRCYCTARGLDVAGVYADEGVSSTKPLHRRPAGARMLKALKAGKAQHLVAKHIDRMFRNTQEALERMDEFDAMGTHVHLMDMMVDTSTSTGRMVLTVLAAVAQMERERLSERVADALQHKKRERQRYCNRVYGWGDRDGNLEPVAAEQAVITRMCQARAGGESLQAIADQLTDGGVTAPAGGRMWHRETVRRILNNDINRAEPAA